ncbi:MAG: PIN domain-containing protein [Draconibacterium sp.]
MTKGYIFDTSVWIDFFKGNQSDETRLLVQHLENDLPVYYCPVILQEILPGIRKDSVYEEVKESFTVLQPLGDDPYRAATGAAELYRNLRKKGITIRKSNDCLIAWYAMNNQLKVIHRDRDFDSILQSADK